MIPRWKILQEWVNTTGSAVAIVGSIVVAAGWALNLMPFVRTDIYQNDMASVRQEVNGIKAMSQETAAALSAVNRNSLLNLELSLRSRIELLNGTMDGVPRNGQIYAGLIRERDTLQQQLDEVKRELGR